MVELEKMRDLDKLENILGFLELATINIDINEEIDIRSQQLENLGFGLYDAFHIACAEVAKVDILLSTDDRLLKSSLRYQNLLNVALDNPVTWLMKVI